MENNYYQMPLIGDKAPQFEAVTTQGNISLPSDYKGKWVILFSHPADFTVEYARKLPSFKVAKEGIKYCIVEEIAKRFHPV